MVRIGVLTSSRADFGVYVPLLKAFEIDPEISFQIIAFGTHLSNLHGKTISNITDLGFKVEYTLTTVLADDSEEAIATSAALTTIKFADFWAANKDDFDIITCIGDRYEMFSAVVSGIPFGIKFAHFYGGDYSPGAIDNFYRNGLTHASCLHFTSTEKNAQQVREMTRGKEPVEVVGLISLTELENLQLLSLEKFYKEWAIDLSKPTILVTFHPETIKPERNEKFTNIIYQVISKIEIDYQIVISMPNADTCGNAYRNIYDKLKRQFPENVFLVENFGILSYFSCMYNSLLMIGNTSSGISEAASFGKYFINVGDRQSGREVGSNVINVEFEEEEIIKAIKKTISLGKYEGENLYRKEDALKKIIFRIKSAIN